MTTRLIVLALPFIVAAAGCEIDPEDDPYHCQLAEPEEIDPTGARYQYVIDRVDLPDTATEASDFGLNLDGDEQGRPDNAIGQIFATVFSNLDVDVDERVQTGIDEARILHLLEVQATALDEAGGVGVHVVLGNDRDEDPTDNFTGAEQFAVESGHPSEALSGYIDEGHLDVALGTVPLRIALPHLEGTFVLHLNAARIDATITEDGIDGILAGVLSERELHDGLIPIIHTSLSASVALDCLAGECFPGSHGETFLDLFDENQDGEIGLEELRENSLMAALFAPDLDMLDGDCDIRPRCDELKDSLSVGVAFTAVPAEF